MASPSQPKKEYHVFLSFRGPDVRENIVSHIYKALKQKGIRTFIDSEELKKGDRISSALIKAIEDSHIAVIVFSENYAFSPWCLDEVVHIMKCKKDNKLSVLPVFYKVEPKEVRKGRGTYQKAFDHYKNQRKHLKDVEKWKKALEDAGSLSGWASHVEVIAESTKGTPIQIESKESKIITESTTPIQLESRIITESTTPIQLESSESKVITEIAKGTPIQIGNRLFKDEANFVSCIVWEIWIKLDPIPLEVATYPVGLDSQVNDLISQLNLNSHDQVLTIGLVSMGGMGKTTLVKALYNTIFKDFEGAAYVDDIKGSLQRREKMIDLQQQLLQQILFTENIIVTSDAQGSRLIEDRLCCKRVLLVLDGVDDKRQIERLAKESKWFGKGSRIIVTTREERVLNIGAFKHYVGPLGKLDAFQLFMRYASENGNRKIKNRKLIARAVKTTQHVPLALKVLGSTFGTSQEDEWESILDEFATSSHPSIDEVLRVSYDRLDPNRQEIFLHIACFFNGWSRRYVESVLHRCVLSAERGVKDLIDRSLIRDENGTLRVHDMIELMGQQIVDREDDDAAQRSRLWRSKDVRTVLTRDGGTNKIKAIVLNPRDREDIKIRCEAFKKLNILSFLIMINVKTDAQGSVCLPDQLRWLEWPECRASSLIFTSPDNLEVLAVRKRLFVEARKP